MAIAAAPEVVEGTIGAAGDTLGSTASGLGLTTGQKGAAIGRALPKPRTKHPYVVGGVLMLIGGFGLIGSLTGTLPSMLAALFVPNALVDSQGNHPQSLIDAALGGLNPLNPSSPFSPVHWIDPSTYGL